MIFGEFSQIKKIMDEIETDLDDLHKKYRIVEGDRKAYSEENHSVLRKQRFAASVYLP